ncbi:MAG: DUF1566 domain-containing protein [Deltaproteobacteria bacterium]|nr:MAG: DUF1566 domain-containing protein [Deltaproteobacteria bacterium]
MSRLRALCTCLITLSLLAGFSPALGGERFTDNGDGTVTDHQLGVMWAKDDNQGDINWRQAEQYCKWTFPYLIPTRYDNWRMPTMEELQSLYVRDKNYKGYESDCGQKIKIVSEIKLSCGWVWTGEVRSITARVYNFQRGYHYMELKRHWKAYRALPVRDLQEGK